MQTKEFTEQLLHLMALARENCVAVMCAEALPWRCHRSLIADALVVRNVKVEHIISKDSVISHELTEWAHVEGTKITYPLFTKETPQKTLGDFGSSPAFPSLSCAWSSAPNRSRFSACRHGCVVRRTYPLWIRALNL